MYDVRTKLLSLNEDIFIPELSFSLNFYLSYHATHYLLAAYDSEISNQFLKEIINLRKLKF